MSAILNLTQHPATADQISQDVIDVDADCRQELSELLTFDELPSVLLIERRAQALVAMALLAGVKRAMIGGAPFLMEPLAATLRANGIDPVYAFSRRESVEKPDGHGGVIKTAQFRHLGFVSSLKIKGDAE